MLVNSFIHIPGVGMRTEQGLWSSGIQSWHDFAESSTKRLSSKKRIQITSHLEQSFLQLEAGNAGYFSNALPADQLWRLFPEFRSSTAYLDIETTGMDGWYSHITTIALYDGQSTTVYVQGDNLERFKEDIQRYKVIVTYNGKCFDAPFIERDLRIELHHVHIDLRYILKRLGYSGGLKGCERQLGLHRGGLEGVDGSFAVLLWDDFQRSRNPKALETLLAYNVQDAVNLEYLLVTAYNLSLNGTPFADSRRIIASASPSPPFHPDIDTIERIRNKYFTF